jgi:hypothetical protein
MCEEIRKMIKEIIQCWEEKNEIEFTLMNLIGVKFKCTFNNHQLFNVFNNFVSSHVNVCENEYSLNFKFNLICDDELYEQLSTIVDNSNNSEEVVLSYCSKESGMVRAYKVKCDSGIKIYKTQKTPTLFVSEEDDGNFYFIIRRSYMDNISFKKDGYKFFEHIINKMLNVNGSVLVHSASIANEDGAVLIVGPKRSGKTTAFLEFIKVLNMSPLAVDKTHLFLNDKQIDVFGFPTRLRVLAGTLKKYGNEFEHLIPEAYKNADHKELWKGDSEGKVDLPYEEFEKFCNKKPFIKQSKLKLIVLPNISCTSKSKLLKPNYEEFYEIFNSQTFTPRNPEEDWWSEIGLEQQEMMLNNKNYLIEYIWNNIPIVKLNAAEDIASVILDLNKIYKASE